MDEVEGHHFRSGAVHPTLIPTCWIVSGPAGGTLGVCLGMQAMAEIWRTLHSWMASW